MPSASELYSRNFNADYFKEKGPKTVTVSGAAPEKMPANDKGREEMKIRLSFLGETQGLILNRTHVNFLVALAGDEYEKWIGLRLELFYDPTAKGFAGRFGGTGIRKAK